MKEKDKQKPFCLYLSPQFSPHATIAGHFHLQTLKSERVHINTFKGLFG